MINYNSPMATMPRCLLAISIATVVASTPNAFAEAESPAAESLSIERITVHGQAPQQQGAVFKPISTSLTPDVRKQLDSEAGLSINSNGLITGILQQRGLFGDRIHISHQGASVFGAGPNAMDSPLSHVVSAASPVATIYRGIAPVSAGYESLGGAVQFNDANWPLSATSQMQYRGTLGAGLANNGEQQQYSGFVEVTSQNWGVRASAQYQTADNYDDGNGDEVLNTLYERALGSLSGIWQDGENEFTYSISHNHTNHSGTPSLAMDIEYIDATWYRVQYQRSMNDSAFRLRVFGNNNRHDMSNFTLRETMGPMQRRNNVASDVLGAAFEYDRQWHLNDNPIDFESGVEWHAREHKSLINNPSNSTFFIDNFNDVERDLLTAFIQFSGQTKQGYFATVGMRPTKVDLNAGDVGSNMAMMNPNVAALVQDFNQSERDQSRQWVDFSLQVGQQVNPYWRAHVSIAQKGRAPNYHELYTWFPLGITAGLADGRNYIGDLNLQEEMATQIELGVDFSNGDLLIQPRLFWYDISDYIIGRETDNVPANRIAMMMGAQQPLQWTNIDAELWGGDISLSYKLANHWQIDASAEWLRGKDTQLNESLYRLAPRRADVTLNYQTINWSGFVSVALVGQQNRVSTLQNEPQTSGYATVDTGMAYQFDSGVNLSLLINNMMNKQYVNHLGGINRVRGGITPAGERLPEMGRSVGLSLRYQF